MTATLSHLRGVRLLWVLLLSLAIFAATSLLREGGAGAPATAAAATRTDCVVFSSITVTNTPTGRQVVGTFSIRNVPGCTDVRVTLAAYAMPAPTFSLPQLLIATATGVFQPGGPYRLTVNVAGCGFHQYDIIESLTPAQLPNPLTAANEPGLRQFVRRAVISSRAPCVEERTPGFWKNWASCSESSGGQAFVLDQVLASTGGIMIGDVLVDTCLEAVRLLNRSTINTNVDMSSHPAYRLASHLLAARLSIAAGAPVCQSLFSAVISAQALLDAVNFTGTGSPVMTAAQAAQADQLATTLDRYNNGLLC